MPYCVIFFRNRDNPFQLVEYEKGQHGVGLGHVTDEWVQRGAVYRNRADVVFLINGLPVAVAETKKAAKPDGLEEGVQQLRRYHKETPELFTSSQVFEVTQLIDFFYGVTWNTARKGLFNWKEEEPRNYERKVKGFFDRPSFLRLLREHLIFLNRDDVLTKIILRQHQTRAVEKAVARAHDPIKRRGLIWHTQGSGKTLTMISIASRLLRDTSRGEKPTVLMIVDRLELEGQLLQNLAHYGISNPREAHSKRELKDILASDYRGLVVSMIHKFDDILANLNTRENVIVLVDEAHRTTGGHLGNYLMGALPNATYVGFTGTPIDRTSQGQGTFKVFGVDDKQGYLDKYSIAESIEDGTTVKLHYSLAPSHLLVDRETLEKRFLDLTEAQGISDVEELNAILDRAVELKELMKARTRIKPIARYVAEHFRSTVEPMGFKAFVVAVDREACVLYKQALDEFLPPDYSCVVYSPSHNDEEHLKAHYLERDEEKRLRKAFVRKDALPKILIVTEKLLTGFDAPILYCMYLDKPMRDHVLLQAIARVNRPYEDEDGLASRRAGLLATPRSVGRGAGVRRTLGPGGSLSSNVRSSRKRTALPLPSLSPRLSNRRWKRGRNTAGSRRLSTEYASEPWAVAALEKTRGKARDPERRPKIAEARRGKSRPAHVIEAMANARRGSHHSEETRRKMSRTHRRLGTLVPGTKAWTVEEDKLVRSLPAGKAAKRTGRSLTAVYTRRNRLEVPDGRRA
jgi:type I restriction enzyme R subunit